MCTYKSFFMFAFCRNFCRAHNGCICTEDRIFRNNAFQLCEQILFQLHIFQYTFYHKIRVLIPLVEVVRTEATTDEVVETVMDMLTRAGKKPVLCKKDVPGFIANRMQHALWREAISIVERGIADAKTVDDACKYSFGLRLPYLPPLVNSDMVGTQLTYNIHDYVLKDLEDSHEPSPLLKEMIDEGMMGFRAETKDGKKTGFMSYTEDEIAEINGGLNEYLIKMLYGK